MFSPPVININNRLSHSSFQGIARLETWLLIVHRYKFLDFGIQKQNLFLTDRYSSGFYGILYHLQHFSCYRLRQYFESLLEWIDLIYQIDVKIIDVDE